MPALALVPVLVLALAGVSTSRGMGLCMRMEARAQAVVYLGRALWALPGVDRGRARGLTAPNGKGGGWATALQRYGIICACGERMSDYWCLW